MSAGTSSVMTMNHLDRTRSRYSRLATTKILLTMARHPGFYAVRADALNEDLVQRRLHELETLDAGASFDEPAQQQLRIGAGGQLDLEEAIVLVELLHEAAVA